MLRYLWLHRCRAPLFTVAFLRLWAKRVLTFPTLLAMAGRRRRLVARGASISPDACLGELNLVGKPARLAVGPGSSLGRVTIMLHDRVQIGAGVCLNDHVTILTASHAVDDPSWTTVSASVVIEDYAWVATQAVILPGVKIGRGAVVGAAAVVSRDVPAYATAAGNPAIVRENRRCRDFSYSPVRFLAFQEAWLGPQKRGTP